MSERLFLIELRMELRELPKETIDEIIEEYMDYFDQANKEGLSDGETIDRLGGNAKKLANSIVEKIHAGKEESQKDELSARSILIAIGLILFNLIIMIGPLIGLAGAGLAVLIIFGLCLISPLLVLVNFIFQGGHVFELMISFVLFGGSLLIYPAVKKGFFGAIEGIKSYILWNKRVIYEGKL